MKQVNTTLRLASGGDKKMWDATVAHPLQSWAWGEFRRAMGLDTIRIVLEKKKRITDCWQLTFHSLPNITYTIGYFPKGPAPTPLMCEELARISRRKHALFIQLEPDILVSASLPPIDNLIQSHHPLFTKYTFVLDLTKSEDALLYAMHPKTRYNIKVAQKHNVQIREDSSANAFEAYLRLSKETLRRQQYFAHSERYHRTMWEILHKAGIAHLFTAILNGEIVSAWIIFVWKHTMYYPYGASSRTHRMVMAPNLLLWEIARWGKRHGMEKFDLWGALGPTPDQNDPWYGFHRFKEGYGPQLVAFAGSYDLVLNPLLYRLYTVADTLRWSFLKFKTKYL